MNRYELDIKPIIKDGNRHEWIDAYMQAPDRLIGAVFTIRRDDGAVTIINAGESTWGEHIYSFEGAFTLKDVVDEANELARVREAIRALHRQSALINDVACVACEMNWPCPTIQAVNGE